MGMGGTLPQHYLNNEGKWMGRDKEGLRGGGGEQSWLLTYVQAVSPVSSDDVAGALF